MYCLIKMLTLLLHQGWTWIG